MWNVVNMLMLFRELVLMVALTTMVLVLCGGTMKDYEGHADAPAGSVKHYVGPTVGLEVSAKSYDERAGVMMMRAFHASLQQLYSCMLSEFRFSQHCCGLCFF